MHPRGGDEGRRISSPLQRVRARKGPQVPPFFVSTIRDNGIQPLTSVCSHCVPVLNRKGPKKTGKRFRRRACKSWLFLRVMLIGAVPSDLIKGFRILWGNPWEFESPRSHSHLHTLPRQAEGRKGGRTEGDFRFQILDFRLQIGRRTTARRGWKGNLRSAICNLKSLVPGLRGSPALKGALGQEARPYRTHRGRARARQPGTPQQAHRTAS